MHFFSLRKPWNLTPACSIKRCFNVCTNSAGMKVGKTPHSVIHKMSPQLTNRQRHESWQGPAA